MSFPLRAEIYTIGKRRYRRNPCPGLRTFIKLWLLFQVGRHLDPEKGRRASEIRLISMMTRWMTVRVAQSLKRYVCFVYQRCSQRKSRVRLRRKIRRVQAPSSQTWTSLRHRDSRTWHRAQCPSRRFPSSSRFELQTYEDLRVSYDEKAKKWSASIYVPAGLMGKFIGTQQRNKIQLEQDTKCRFVVFSFGILTESRSRIAMPKLLW